MTSRPAGPAPVAFLKRGLIAFWSVWLTVVFVTNAFDAARALGLLDLAWPFASGNYRFLVDTTARYHPPTWLNGLLFGCVLVWEGTAAALFWVAWARFPTDGRPARYRAFAAGLGLWGAFAVADELCIAYAVEGTHLRLFTAQLVTLLAIELLPERFGRAE